MRPYPREVKEKFLMYEGYICMQKEFMKHFTFQAGIGWIGPIDLNNDRISGNKFGNLSGKFGIHYR